MRRMWILLLSVALFAALPVSDSFTDFEAAALSTHNASWVVTNGNIDISNNRPRGNANSTYSLGVWTGDTFAANQYSSATVAVLHNSSMTGVGTRMSSGAATGYICVTKNSGTYIKYILAGVDQGDVATTATVPTVGQTISLEANGTTLTCKLNGVSALSGTNSALASGYAGIVAYSDGDAAIDDWTAGNLSGAAAVRRKTFIVQ